MEQVKINVYGVTGNTFCVDSEDGKKVFDLIKKALLEKKVVSIDFRNIEMVTSAFLNTAFGQLYGDFPENLIQSNLSIEEISDEDVALLKRVVATAKLYFKDPQRMEKSINEVLGE
ncbi:MAG: STAS-like domain-containing protein [archaeon]